MRSIYIYKNEHGVFCTFYRTRMLEMLLKNGVLHILWLLHIIYIWLTVLHIL